ncbi:hypothetical protein D7X33_09710 [Butyricicoccus sp. 1XD8-22]|nr:hypothetical protein D7X33_09710 [Butyricicoccus sp. 1XD8-22]
MNEDRRDALSVDDILNEYHAADAAHTRRAAPPEPATAPVRAARPQPVMAQAPQQAAQLGAVQAASQPRSSAQKKAPSQTAKKPASKKPVHKKRDYYDDYDEEPRRRGGGALIAVMLLFLLAVGGTCAFGAYAFLCKTVFPGVKVGGVEVGGMSVNEAANLISSSFDEQGTGELTLQMDEYTFNLPVSEVVGGVDANESARAAFRFGREGGPVERALDIVKARITGADVELTMDVDKKKLTEWLDGIAGESFDGPVQPSYEVVEDQLIVNLGAPGVNFADRAGVESKLLEKLRIMDLEPLSVEATIQDQEAIDLAEVQKAIECEPKSATLDPADGVTVVPGTDGIKMDLEEAKSIIGDATTGEFSIPLELTEAEIDAETLQSLLFRDTLAATETKLNPNEKSRTNNVELACNYINGTILNPGDEFSYNKVVGERTVARGFREAGVFVSGRLEEGMGGGVCQPSSTLYMAVLRADLKVTERSNHGMTVSYTPLGEDATVSWGTLDFRFVNDTEYPVKILASREGSYCKMKILGTNLTGKKVEIKTNTLSKTSWTTVRQLDTSLKPGTERVDQSGSNGYRTETFKVITENGQTTTVKANDSNYRKRDKLVLYNDSSQAAGTDESVLPADPTKPADPTTTPGDTTTTTPPATPVEPVAPTEPVTPAPQPTTPVEYDPETPMFGPGQPIV